MACDFAGDKEGEEGVESPPLRKHGQQMLLQKMTSVVLLVGWRATENRTVLVNGLDHCVLLYVKLGSA